jgi:cystathionine beta-synthase
MWMKDHGFTEERSFATAREIILNRNGKDTLYTVTKKSTIGEAIRLMNKEGVDQVPVLEGNEFVGSVTTANLVEKIISDPLLKDKSVGEIMDAPMQVVAFDTTLDVLSSMLNKTNRALLVRDEKENAHIITQHDILRAITS